MDVHRQKVARPHLGRESTGAVRALVLVAGAACTFALTLALSTADADAKRRPPPSPTVSPSPSPSPTTTRTPTPSPSATPTVTPSPTPTVMATPTPTPTPTPWSCSAPLETAYGTTWCRVHIGEVELGLVPVGTSVVVWGWMDEFETTTPGHFPLFGPTYCPQPPSGEPVYCGAILSSMSVRYGATPPPVFADVTVHGTVSGRAMVDATAVTW